MNNKEQFRMFFSSFWTDGQISEDMTPEDRYFYAYLLTNPNSSQLGVYEITRRTMAFQLGYTPEVTNNLLKRFEEFHNLVKYNPETKEIAILKWGKYNWNRGGKPVWDLVKREIDEVKDKSLIMLVAQSSPDTWLKQQIREYMDAQGYAQCAGETENSESSSALEQQGIQESCAKTADDSYHNKEEIINNNKTYTRNSSELLKSEFDEFWKVYSKKKDKQRAFTKFKAKRKKHSFEVIMKGAVDYMKECSIKRTDVQFIKHPTTFLNGDCFLDDFETKELVLAGASTNPEESGFDLDD